MHAKWILALALFAPLPSGAAAPASGDSITIAGRADGIPIEELVRQAEQVTGELFFFEPKDLKEEKVYFAGELAVPRERFLSFFERCVASCDLVHIESRTAGVVSHRLMKLGQQARGQQTLKTMASSVTESELLALAERHLLVTTIYQTKKIPAREAVTTLQLYFADSATESIRNVEGTDHIVMTGFSDNLCRFVNLLKSMDAAAADDGRFMQLAELSRRLERVERQLAAVQPQAPPASGR